MEVLTSRLVTAQRSLSAKVEALGSDAAEDAGTRPHLTPATDFMVMPFCFQCLGTFRGHNGPIWSITSDGHTVFTAGSDEVIKVGCSGPCRGAAAWWVA